ncbi:protein chiffon [Scaptodrosophila lebanonensis]|uniref:Protein chiffon n=1 Tax=Drosophila lebanonensis TaxID=7225 RepID=A0A6J2UAT8_DROLE|nr:protein chiffon [Scaptodrosophila lebanonensis]
MFGLFAPKGMQPQSDKQTASKLATTTTAATGTTNSSKQQTGQIASATTTTSSTAVALTQRPKVKVIKSKRPLCHFKFYLDICDHQLTKRIESEIKALGGALEFFLNENITHFITDKTTVPSSTTTNCNNNSISRPATPQTPPVTPNTPQTPNEDAPRNQIGSAVTRKTRQTRADAILSRVRRQQSSNAAPSTPTSTQQSQTPRTPSVGAPTYTVWQTDYAQRFFKRIQTELRDYLEGEKADTHLTTNKKNSNNSAGNNNNNAHLIQLKGSFIKIESIKRNYRPYYHLIKKPDEWPKIDLKSEDGAFRLQAKPKLASGQLPQRMTRKSVGSRTSQRQQQQQRDGEKPEQQPAQHAKVQALKKNSISTTPGSPRSRLPQSHCRELKESSDKQCGVCEICKIEYDTLTVHLQTKDHESFANNAENFIALDTLIQTSADLNKFLTEEVQANRGIEQEDDETEQIRGGEEEEDEEHGNVLCNEMEVDELLCDSAITNTTNNHTPTLDPLRHSPSGDVSRGGRPSPALREKSKRTTKGKHSSEKFHATTPTPATPSPKHSPTKSHGSGSGGTKKATPGSLLELQRLEQAASNSAVAATTPATTATRRKTQNSAVSPPIRAMLPPSSLYKVVETTDVCATPPRGRRGAAAANSTNVDSPSLIVKFQKVRQSELARLNGEAENFMFPKAARSSSELPTDVDRQTTSDRARNSISSASLDSTSEADPVTMPEPVTAKGRRAIAVPKRRKGVMPTTTLLQRQLSTGSTSSSSTGAQQQQQQRFPSAPIQPETQQQVLDQQRPASKQTEKPTTPAAVPEATRKSSRTATAIVTAATASSQLLRAAVEAAKHGKRRYRRRKPLETVTSEKRTAGGRQVAKLEDWMGEQRQDKGKDRSEDEVEPEQNHEDDNDDDDDDEEEEEDEEDDDGSDEDFVISRQSKSQTAPTAIQRVDTREERAARRLSRLTINRSAGELEPLALPLDSHSPEAKSTPNRRGGRVKSQKPTTPKSKQQQQTQQPQQTSPQSFDFTKSERLQKIRYAFEQMPSSELWHRVFMRQDAAEENYYTYFGSTEYCKLPYEMGPIPFERTLPKLPHRCALCPRVEEKEPVKPEEPKQEEQVISNPTATISKATETETGVYKHKKLHLLQRYQLEQQQQQEQLGEPSEMNANAALTLNTTAIPKCDSKASTPELLERDFVPLSERTHVIGRLRADSTQSSTSSSCSTTASGNKPAYRNKQLQRIAELPPRKSPREHASTLALVSCIIRQRQDSQSKTNSEVDEPIIEQQQPETTDLKKLRTPIKQETSAVVSCPSPRTTRSQAATPVEELRFATEISETVKRMRRGQNKYDHSPPVPPPRPATASRSPRGRRPANTPVVASTTQPLVSCSGHSYSRRLQFATRRELPASVLLGKRTKRRNQPNTRIQQGTVNNNANNGGYAPGVRKLPTKKGVLEFEIDAIALRKLDANLKPHLSARLAAWQLDKYLELAGKEYDLDSELIELNSTIPTATANCELRADTQTPPPTDCFTSDFDLCDLLMGAGSGEEDEPTVSGFRRSSQGLYSSAAMQSYYRKRKSLKSNRTGWPSQKKRRSATNGRQMPDQRISFQKIGICVQEDLTKQQLHRIKQEALETEEEQTTTTTTADKVHSQTTRDDNDEDDDEDGSSGGGGNTKDARGDGVMTPPATDVDEQGADTADKNDDAEDEEDEEENVADSIMEDDESVEELQDDEAEIEATDADVEEAGEDDDDDDDDDDVYEDAFEHQQHKQNGDRGNHKEDAFKDCSDEPPAKRSRLQQATPIDASMANVDEDSPGKKVLIALHNTNGHLLSTSTPSTQLARQHQRRTPQLNGSLGSCISPSEKLGDNSDIFTVSSDGLDTDLDLSNTQAGDEHQCPHQTPKRKFDISKYAPPNNGKAASSCAAEAATAAAKSLAISQFLKKEVRVTCRRLRAPFRRFRYRR